MSPYKQPPLSCRFVEGRSGNPLGRPKKLYNTELLLLAIKFLDELARAYYHKGHAARRLDRIRKVLNEK